MLFYPIASVRNGPLADAQCSTGCFRRSPRETIGQPAGKRAAFRQGDNTKCMWPFSKRKPAPAELRVLSGAPPLPRMKTYSAESGYVYQYVYRGHRREADATEFVFSATADRKNWKLLSICISDAAVQDWASSSSRKLMDAERYGVVKLALFEFFDRTSGLGEGKPVPLWLEAQDIQRHLTTLGRE